MLVEPRYIWNSATCKVAANAASSATLSQPPRLFTYCHRSPPFQGRPPRLACSAGMTQGHSTQGQLTRSQLPGIDLLADRRWRVRAGYRSTCGRVRITVPPRPWSFEAVTAAVHSPCTFSLGLVRSPGQGFFCVAIGSQAGKDSFGDTNRFRRTCAANGLIGIRQLGNISSFNS